MPIFYNSIINDAVNHAKEKSWAPEQLGGSWQDMPKHSSGNKVLDELLAGGLPADHLVEWGVPPGKGGRKVLLHFIREFLRKKPEALALWIYDTSFGRPYPPTWRSKGLDVKRLAFAQSANPLRDLLPVFFEPVFSWVVVDCAWNASPEDLEFLASRARACDMTIILLRPQFLRQERGQTWASARLNSWYEAEICKHIVQVFSGAASRQLALTL